jgi:hypothetical protein
MSLPESKDLVTLTRGATATTLTKRGPGSYIDSSRATNSPLIITMSGTTTGVRFSLSFNENIDPSTTPVGNVVIDVSARGRFTTAVTRNATLKPMMKYIASLLTEDTFIDQLMDGEK